MLRRDIAASLQKILCRSFNSLKSYVKTNMTVFVLSLWEKYRWGLTSFDQFSFWDILLTNSGKFDKIRSKVNQPNQLTKFQTPSLNSFRDILLTSLNFKMPKFSKGHNSGKNWRNLLKVDQINLLIILYQLTKFQAPSSNTFRDILLTRFHSDCFKRALTPEREITWTKKKKKKIQVGFFSLRNPYMKFQNPSIHGS